jgi:GNAT superfamily N-acetyltransferase
MYTIDYNNLNDLFNVEKKIKESTIHLNGYIKDFKIELIKKVDTDVLGDIFYLNDFFPVQYKAKKTFYHSFFSGRMNLSNISLIMVYSDIPIGFALNSKKENNYQTNGLVVNDSYQGLGIGKELIDISSVIAKEYFCNNHLVTCDKDLINYYKKLGFKKKKENNNLIHKENTLVDMIKKI